MATQISPTTLTGGGFQDCLGNPLSYGTLVLQLSQDAIVNSNMYICASDTITINLDEDGNVSNTPIQIVWQNDAMTPNTTFYYVTAYSFTGELVYGPNNFQVLSTPSPYPLSAWIPV